jgi:hypothetical protein
MKIELMLSAKNLAFWRLDDLSIIDTNYNLLTDSSEPCILALKCIIKQLFGRMVKPNKSACKIMAKNSETYTRGNLKTRQRYNTTRALLLFRATKSIIGGERLDFLTCLNVLESIPSVELTKEIIYYYYKPSKTLLERDLSYKDPSNKEYVKRIRPIGQADLVWKIYSHLSWDN